MLTGRSGETLLCRQPRAEKPDLPRRWLLASTAIGLAFTLTLSQLVYADNECGAIVGNSVTCTPAGNNYTGGITYKPTDDLTIVADDNVRIFPSSGNEGIDVIFGGDVDIEMSGKISTLGDYDAGTPFGQRLAKLEGGFDNSFIARDGARAVLGAFAGAGKAEQDFSGSSSEADSDMALAGVYGGYRRGAFYGNAIVKYEHYWADLRTVATDADGAPFGLDLLGGSLESGYRFAAGGSYMQPRLRVNYVHALASSLADASGAVIDLKNAESLSGEAAARLGFRPGNGFGLSDFYAETGIRHEVLGNTEAEVSGFIYSDALPGTAAFVSGGLAASLFGDKLSLSLEAGYAKGEEAEEITATGAVRLIY